MNWYLSNKQHSCSQKVPYVGKAQLEKGEGIKIRYDMRQESGVYNKKLVFICLRKDLGA